MQKTRPRRTGKQTDPAAGAERTPGSTGTTTGKGRPTHVRNRLVVAVAVVAAAIAGAGAPSVLAASGQLKDSQDLVTLAGQTQDALNLAHSLADERDEVTSYIAVGRAKSKAPTEQASARVDRQVEDLRENTDTSASLRGDLDDIAALRRSALTGKSSALEAHDAYSAAITELHGLAEQLAQQMPPRAGSGAYALAELDSAVQQSAAARGLLLAALSVPTSQQSVISPTTGLPTTTTTSSAADTKQRNALTAAAQQARLRSDAALADFHDTAPKAARTSYDSTVTGAEVNSAEQYLAALTDQPTLSPSELGTRATKVDAALSARIDAMRGAESALYDRRTKDLAQLRDDDVSTLELRIAVLGALMLLAVGVATAMARSLTRPLSVLRRGSARLAEAEDPAAQEPVTFTGRNDEFAQVVRSVNTLHAHAAALHERIATLEADRKHLVGQRQKMADAREELRTDLADSAAQLERLRESIGGRFVNLALRTLGLVERQLAVIEGLEEREHDPDRLATLFKLDHFATVMRRHSENLLVLAGTEHVQQSAHPVPLVDVVRAAVSEIERYERVRIAVLPPHAYVAGFAADDLSHLLAELLENATTFSPPDLPVEISGWLLENGEVMLSVQDEGIGMAGEQMTRLNARLAEFDPETSYNHEGDEGLGLGLYVVARLAHRHGVRVQLREQKQGGVAAVVVVPGGLLASAQPSAVPSATAPTTGATPAFSLPGADAEANSNILYGRSTSTDPLVALAENAIRERPEPTPEPVPAPAAPTAPEPTATEPQPTSDDVPPTAGSQPGLETSAAAGSQPGLDGAADVEPQPAFDAAPATGPQPGSDVPADAEPQSEADVPADVEPQSEADVPADAEPQSALGAPVDAGQQSGSDAPAASEPQPEFGAPAGGEPQPGLAVAPAAGQQSTFDVPADAGQQSESDVTAESEPQPELGAPADAEPQSESPVPDVPAAEITMELLIPSFVPEAQDEPVAETPESHDRPAHETAEAHPQPAAGTIPLPAQRAAADAEFAPQGPPAPDGQVGTSGAGGYTAGEGDAEAEHTRTPDEEPVTAKGLPKRTPKITAPTQSAPPRRRSVDAEALRRRLGGFRQGAQAGYRDVETEIAERTAQTQVPAQAPTRVPTTEHAVSEEATGGTVEEASS
ncbi:nitrate- and nitrite sensing domain-containing protein [Streptomyces sp. NBC_00452]|uniref:sensor histidine kinase n=1 Tax=Streptomyces sp. NBC_00452 TaxID=2975746 RepID=UPI0022575A0C|nr:nitrate- and nitrite sensing domain-containing protein [Streptomyces sp. NBC_00452]MCX5061367.1 nitrate- and nitrite sensing domain-containing protein [Streptomyces sp. NBC_00452]